MGLYHLLIYSDLLLINNLYSIFIPKFKSENRLSKMKYIIFPKPIYYTKFTFPKGNGKIEKIYNPCEKSTRCRGGGRRQQTTHLTPWFITIYNKNWRFINLQHFNWKPDWLFLILSLFSLGSLLTKSFMYEINCALLI